MSENRLARSLRRGTVPVMITQSHTPPPTVPSPPNKIPTDTANPGTPAPVAATRFAYIESPVGELLVTADATGALTRLYFPGRISPQEAGWTHDEAPFVELRRQLDAYFAGELEDEIATHGVADQRH